MKREFLLLLALAAVLGTVYAVVRASRASSAVVVTAMGEGDDDGLPPYVVDISDVYPEMLAQWAAEARARRAS